ncbi:MAG: phosphoglycerate mutase, partial [Chloroflexi bacterium]
SIQFFLKLIKEHRFAFVMRAPGLSDDLTETDPLKTGVAPRPVTAAVAGSEKAASLVNRFLDEAKVLLAEKYPANMILLRGFAKLPALPSYAERFGLHAASIAIHGMYRGVSSLAGMQVLDTVGSTIADQFTTLEKCWDAYEFFYMHVKATDTCGENGDFDGKVRVIEEVDALIPRLTALQPDVVIISGDHSSPAVMKAHSWHPVPTLVYSKYARPDGIEKFGERVCARGSLGILPAMDIMPIALANAGRIAKYGA